jgi:hypothetical protein
MIADNNLIGERRELNRNDCVSLGDDSTRCRIAPSLYLEFIVAQTCEHRDSKLCLE